MKNPIKDERILHMQQKIAGDAYSIAVILLFLSMLVKIYWMELPFAACFTELAVILICSVYVVTANLLGGSAGFESKKDSVKTYGLKSAAMGIVVSAPVSTVNYFRYPQNRENLFYFFISAAILFASAFLFSFLSLLSIGFVSKKRAEKIAKRLDEDEQKL